QFLADYLDVFAEVVAGDHVQHGETRRTADRVTAERRAVLAWTQQLGRGTDADHRAERQAATEALGQGDHIGGDPGTLKGEPLAGARDAGLYLVQHEQRTGGCGDLSRCAQVV